MASEALNELASSYKMISMQLEAAIKQEFPLFSVVKSLETGDFGVFISPGIIPNWVHIRVDNVNQEWKINDTERCNDESLWPEWIKKAKGKK